ncbi:MAG: vWA domain-containing protein [Planctomycetota bacterium]
MSYRALLQVNAPFQRLRRNILLLLQMLMLLAILFALAGPVMSLTAGPGEKYVLLIDRSASMNATDIKPTRLGEAKDRAKTFIESLRDQAPFSFKTNPVQAMVIAFDQRAKVMCNFTADKRRLMAAIDEVTAGDGKSSLAEAVVVARAFAQPVEVESNNRSAQDPAKLVLFSDGRITDTDQVVIAEDEMIFESIGNSNENVAITAMQARRTFEDPEQVEIFATVANYSQEQITTQLQLSLNADVRTVREITLPPATEPTLASVAKPSKVSVNFELSHSQAGVIELRQLHEDDLPCDDAAWAMLPPPKKMSVLLVTAGNPVLESALKALQLDKIDINTPEQFDAVDHSTITINKLYDVIVLDSHSPPKLPRGAYLTFGPPPVQTGVTSAGKLQNQFLVDWRPRHAILKHVNLANLFAANTYQLAPPRDADILAEFSETPALVLARRGGSVFVVAGFDLLETNWPFEPGFVLFCYNAIAYLGIQFGSLQQTSLNVGEPINVEGLEPDSIVEITGPELAPTQLNTGPDGVIRFHATDRVGTYGIEIPQRTPKLFAVNILDTQESDIEPRKKIDFSGQAVLAQQGSGGRANMPVWPFLVAIVLALALVEWFVYNSKVRI